MISGLLLPFALLYLDGLERVSRLLSPRLDPLLVLVLLILAITANELYLTREFSSPHNWFHMF